MTDTRPRIAFQGDFGANSDEACRDYYPSHAPVPCSTFEDAFEAVKP
jgi:prephenate dehydratase